MPAAALVLLGACGSDGNGGDAVDADDTTVEDETPDLTVDADVVVIAEDIEFPTTSFAAPAGEIEIAYVNEGAIRHTLVLEGVDDWDKLTVDANGDAASGSVELEPGDYTLFCDVAGHRAAGMEATLTVS